LEAPFTPVIAGRDDAISGSHHRSDPKIATFAPRVGVQVIW